MTAGRLTVSAHTRPAPRSTSSTETSAHRRSRKPGDGRQQRKEYPMLHFHPTDPAIPPTVTGQHDTGVLRVDMTSVGGEIDEYELTIAEALRFSQRLRDAAVSMQEFLRGREKETTA